MKAKLSLFQEVLVKEVYVYRQPNGCVLIRVDMKDKWTDADHSRTWTGEKPDGEHELVELDIQIWDNEKIVGVVTIIPETPEEITLFSNAYYMKMTYKHRIHYYVAPKTPDIEPEPITMIE